LLKFLAADLTIVKPDSNSDYNNQKQIMPNRIIPLLINQLAACCLCWPTGVSIALPFMSLTKTGINVDLFNGGGQR